MRLAKWEVKNYMVKVMNDRAELCIHQTVLISVTRLKILHDHFHGYRLLSRLQNVPFHFMLQLDTKRSC